MFGQYELSSMMAIFHKEKAVLNITRDLDLNEPPSSQVKFPDSDMGEPDLLRDIPGETRCFFV